MQLDQIDVLIVGGGPVGLATAIGCARRGLSVRLLERGTPPVDKACGEGIMPDGVRRLGALGVDPIAAGGRPFRGIRYVDQNVTAEARFTGNPGLGIRRTRLQLALVEVAGSCGVRMDFGVTVRGLSPMGSEGGAVRTDRGTIEARFVIGADGLSSRVRRWCDLEVGSSSGRLGVRRHYRIEPWSDLVEVHWADGCEAYVTPVGDREVGVALLWSGPKGRLDELLLRFPALAERLGGAEITSRDRGAGPLERRAWAVHAGRFALVGDAAGYLDAITGEGLTAGLAQAEALAGALDGARSGDALRAYGREHRRIQRLPTLLMRALLAVERRPRLRRRLIDTLARDPALFERLLEVHVGERKPSHIGWRGVVGMSRLLVDRH